MDSIPAPIAIVNVMNMVPYRIGISIDDGPVFVSGGAVLDIVSPGTEAMMKLHYPENVTSEEIEVPIGDRIEIMIVVPSNRNSPLSGTIIEPQTSINEVVYAYSIDCTNRLTQRRITRTGSSYVYVIDSDAPRLPWFPLVTPPEYWSYDGPVEGGGTPGEIRVPSRVDVIRESLGLSPTTPVTNSTVTPPEANRSYLFWFILAGIALIALIGIGALIYWLATRSSATVVAIDQIPSDMFTPTLVL